jgi:hypothetical protein
VLKIDIFLQRSKKSFTESRIYKTGIFTFDTLNYEVRMRGRGYTAYATGSRPAEIFYSKPGQGIEAGRNA